MAIRNSINTDLQINGLQIVNPFGTAFSSVVLSDGQMLIGSTGAAPVAATISGSSGVAVTAGAGSLAIAGTQATTAALGVVELADSAEAIAGTDADRAITPSTLLSKLGAMTLNALPVAAGSAAAMSYVGPLTNGQLLIGSTGAAPVAAALTAGPGIGITNAAGAITISSLDVVWSAITASQTAATYNGYFVTANAVVVALPATSAIGDTFELCLAGGTSWSISQAAGQQIFFGSSASTAGVGGSLASTAQGDCVRLVCRQANLQWQVVSSVGNLNIV
jgi:hypothetical protein